MAKELDEILSTAMENEKILEEERASKPWEEKARVQRFGGGNQPNLLVAINLFQGSKMIKALGLDPNQWYLISPGTTVAGRRYRKIVVILQADSKFHSQAEKKLYKEYLEYLKILLLPENEGLHVFGI